MSGIQPVSFKGTTTPSMPTGPRGVSLLTRAGSAGNDAGLVTMSTSLAVMLLRPLVIMFDKNSTKEEKIYAASWIAALSAAGLAMQAALYKPFGKLANQIATKVFRLKADKAIKGAEETVKFVLFNAAAIAATYLNTRYIGKLLDKISLKLTGKKFSKEPDKPLTEDQKKKKKRKDKTILGIFLGIGAFVGLNIIGRRLGKGPIASDALAKGYKSTVKFLTDNSKMFRNLKTYFKVQGDKFAKWINRSNTGLVENATFRQKISHKFSNMFNSNWFAKQAEVGDGWIIRNMIANTIVRPTIAMLNGQPYVAFRCIVDEGLGAIVVKFAGDPLIRASKPLVNKLFRVTPKTLSTLTPDKAGQVVKGAEIITGQLVRNIGLLCIALGFMNNFISARMVKLMDKFKKNKPQDSGKNKVNPEQGYKDFRKNFIPAAQLSQERQRIVTAQNPQEWLNALHSTSTAESLQFNRAIRDYYAAQSQVNQKS